MKFLSSFNINLCHSFTEKTKHAFKTKQAKSKLDILRDHSAHHLCQALTVSKVRARLQRSLEICHHHHRHHHHIHRHRHHTHHHRHHHHEPTE